MAKDKKHKKDKKRKKEKKEKKSKKERRQVSSSESSSDSDDSGDEREHKRQRVEKKAKKIAQRLRGTEIAGYSNESNPFNDQNLTERFVWHKKLEMQVDAGTDVKDLGLRAEKKKYEQQLKEIERVKERRAQRETELAQMEEDKNLMARDRALAEAVELEKKEEEFHLEQARQRSIIRLADGRGKPIDILSRNLNGDPKEFDLQGEDPTMVFLGLTHREILDLKEDIRVQMELDSKEKTHSDFWQALMVVAEAEEEESSHRDKVASAHIAGLLAPQAYEAGLHSSVDADVKQMLDGKTSGELEDTEREICDLLATGGGGDPEYWDAVLKRLKVYKARTRLKDIHRELRLRAHTSQAPDERAVVEAAMGWGKHGEADGEWVSLDRQAAEEDPRFAGLDREVDYEMEEEEEEEPTEEPLAEAGPSRSVPLEENVGQWSPRYVSSGFRWAEVVSAEEDEAELAQLRRMVQDSEGRQFTVAATAATASTPAGTGDLAYRQMTGQAGGGAGPHRPMLKLLQADGSLDDNMAAQRAMAEKSMGAASGEVEFAGEVQLESQAYWWHDKYRPRKPKYFNRVHTGYEWNKYNQTHYDHDNPPPKVVQGYKFNIFYPDLINKTEAPRYEVVADGSKHGETAMLVFHAGPPYEDIAFKIVNKDWEYSHKKGFKCSFERGIMHLYINFKRFRYRR